MDERTDRILKEALKSLDNCHALIDQFYSNHNDWIRELAGARLEEISSSADAAERCLTDSDHRLRIAALDRLHKLDEDRAVVHCKRLATQDVSPGVRAIALALIRGNSVDSACLDMAARIVLNELETPYVRLTAYGLLRTHCRLYERNCDRAEPVEERIRQIDVEFVRQFLFRKEK